MFFSRRRKFNATVVQLFAAFEFDVDDVGGTQTLNALDITWKKEFSEHEAAYYIAILMLSGWVEAGEYERAHAAHQRLKLVAAKWLILGLISEPFVSGQQPMVDGIMRRIPDPSPR